MPHPITTPGEIARRRQAFLAAKSAWDADEAKDRVRTIRLGEEVYFTALTLVDALDEVIGALIDVRPVNWDDEDDPAQRAAWRLAQDAADGPHSAASSAGCPSSSASAGARAPGSVERANYCSSALSIVAALNGLAERLRRSGLAEEARDLASAAERVADVESRILPVRLEGR